MKGALLALIGVGVLIVDGVSAYMMSGGVHALRVEQAVEDAARPAAAPPLPPSASALPQASAPSSSAPPVLSAAPPR